MYMKDWVAKLDVFLGMNDKPILLDIGKVSHEEAEVYALREFEKYRAQKDHDLCSDFDEFLERAKKLGEK